MHEYICMGVGRHAKVCLCIHMYVCKYVVCMHVCRQTCKIMCACIIMEFHYHNGIQLSPEFCYFWNFNISKIPDFLGKWNSSNTRISGKLNVYKWRPGNSRNTESQNFQMYGYLELQMSRNA